MHPAFLRIKRAASVITMLLASLAAAAFIAVVLQGQQTKPGEPEEPSVITPVYDLYIGFTARTTCVPKNGPYLTELHYDFHVPRLRFNFTKRALDGLMVNWFPYHGERNESTYPVLTFITDGQVDAELCPHQLCPVSEDSSKMTLKKAWFTKRNKACQAVVSVVPFDEIKDAQAEALIIDAYSPAKNKPRDLEIMHVTIMAHGNFAYTGECTTKGDAGETSGLEFNIILPSWDLRNGRAAEATFPFQSDDIDAKGQLTIRFTPVGSIK